MATIVRSKTGSRSKDNMCIDCGKSVGEKEKGLECELCLEWYHSRCQGIGDELYKAMGPQKSVHWFCQNCNKEAVKKPNGRRWMGKSQC